MRNQIRIGLQKATVLTSVQVRAAAEATAAEAEATAAEAAATEAVGTRKEPRCLHRRGFRGSINLCLRPPPITYPFRGGCVEDSLFIKYSLFSPLPETLIYYPQL